MRQLIYSRLLYRPFKLEIFQRFKTSKSKVTSEPMHLEQLVPLSPVALHTAHEKLPKKTYIDSKTLELLERLSLVDCANKEGIKTLEDAIEFADKIFTVNTEGVEPLISVLEDRPIDLREDVVTEGNCRQDILSNAKLTEEEYFVAPPGNIPLEPRDNLLFNDKVLTFCHKSNFFQCMEKTGQLMRVGPCGAMLKENIRQEWILAMGMGRNEPVCLADTAVTSLDEALAQAHELFTDTVRFGVVLPHTGVCAHKMPADGAPRFFNQWQRQRKIWWKKLSANPNRYELSDVISNSNREQTVDIVSQLPWGTRHLERLTLRGDKDENVCLVTSEVNLSEVLVNALLDAFDKSHYSENYLFRLHRKLAPYKMGVALSPQDTSNSDLIQLAQFLTKNLRSKHISVLHAESYFAAKLNLQFEMFDKLGIPFSLHLEETSLKNGIIKLRNRDTNLVESVHIGKLLEHSLKLFENY